MRIEVTLKGKTTSFVEYQGCKNNNQILVELWDNSLDLSILLPVKVAKQLVKDLQKGLE